MRALVVIDVQCGMFADPAMPPHDGEAVVGRIAGLIGRARAAGVEVIFVQHDGGEGDVLARGAAGFEIRPELAPRAGEAVVVKRFCSAFQETELAELVAKRGITGLTVCGMQTEYCVDTTCRSAFERGLVVTLVSDGHTTMDGVMPAAGIIAHHNATLGSGFVTLRRADEVVFGGG
jgi:nicotinamidase-related amidase